MSSSCPLLQFSGGVQPDATMPQKLLHWRKPPLNPIDSQVLPPKSVPSHCSPGSRTKLPHKSSVEVVVPLDDEVVFSPPVPPVEPPEPATPPAPPVPVVVEDVVPPPAPPVPPEPPVPETGVAHATRVKADKTAVTRESRIVVPRAQKGGWQKK